MPPKKQSGTRQSTSRAYPYHLDEEALHQAFEEYRRAVELDGRLGRSVVPRPPHDDVIGPVT
jgi:hypothetical protein